MPMSERETSEEFAATTALLLAPQTTGQKPENCRQAGLYGWVFTILGTMIGSLVWAAKRDVGTTSAWDDVCTDNPYASFCSALKTTFHRSSSEPLISCGPIINNQILVMTCNQPSDIEKLISIYGAIIAPCLLVGAPIIVAGCAAGCSLLFCRKTDADVTAQPPISNLAKK